MTFGLSLKIALMAFVLFGFILFGYNICNDWVETTIFVCVVVFVVVMKVVW